MKMVRLTDEVHRELVKIAGRLQSQNGKAKTLDDAIRYLLKKAEG